MNQHGREALLEGFDGIIKGISSSSSSSSGSTTTKDGGVVVGRGCGGVEDEPLIVVKVLPPYVQRGEEEVSFSGRRGRADLAGSLNHRN